MSALGLVILIIIGGAVAWLLYTLATCPEGWEDERGFHERGRNDRN